MSGGLDTPERHRPDAIRAQGRCRVNCTCGWRGPLVALPGHGYAPWSEHFKEADDLPAPSVPAELPDTGRSLEPWEYFDGD